MEFCIYLIILSYNIFDVFMVMYFSNEITLLSDSLSYCLFESDWVGQSEKIKKVLLIFGERLKQSEQLVILKLYPLTLDLFTRVCIPLEGWSVW